MRLEHLDVVHVALPVLDVAAVVARHHPHVVVTPLHGPHRAVVGLENGLKVEGKPVPQSELPARGASDQSPALRSPGQTEDGAPHLVGGCLDESRGDTIHWIVQ